MTVLRALAGCFLGLWMAGCADTPTPPPAVINMNPPLAIQDPAPLDLETFEFSITVDTGGNVTYSIGVAGFKAIMNDFGKLQDRVQLEEQTIQKYKDYYEAPPPQSKPE